MITPRNASKDVLASPMHLAGVRPGMTVRFPHGGLGLVRSENRRNNTVRVQCFTRGRVQELSVGEAKRLRPM